MLIAAQDVNAAHHTSGREGEALNASKGSELFGGAPGCSTLVLPFFFFFDSLSNPLGTYIAAMYRGDGNMLRGHFFAPLISCQEFLAELCDLAKITEKC